MIFRSLTASGDWTFGQGLSNYARNGQAIDFNIKTRLLSWVGNCFFALPDGIDWHTRLDKGQRQNLLNDLRAEILQSFGVVGINSFDFVFDARTRALIVSYNIQTIFSPSFQSQVAAAVGLGGAGA